MDYYIYLNIPIKELKEEIMRAIPARYDHVYGWDDLCHLGVDGYIVNIGYLILRQNKCGYREYRNQMLNELRFLERDYECRLNQINEIVAKVWLAPFQIGEGEKNITLAEIFNKQMPIFERLMLNKNFAAIGFYTFAIISVLSILVLIGSFERPKDVYWLFYPSIILGMFAPFLLIPRRKTKTYLIIATFISIPLFYCYSAISVDSGMISAYICLCASVLTFWGALAFRIVEKRREELAPSMWDL